MAWLFQEHGAYLLFAVSSLIYWGFGWFLLWRLSYCVPARCEAVMRSISIILPARNESERLPALLASLQREGAFSKYEVILADDGSTDATAEVALRAGCRVVRVDDKPERAIGKSWACWKAAQGAAGEILLFLDADVWFLPGGIDAVISRYGGGLMSVQPYHRFKKFYESFSAFFNLLAMAGVGSFSLGADPVKPRGCFGPCMVCEKKEYIALGGHAAVMTELVDDVALAGLYRRSGVPVFNRAGRGSVEYRMYPEGMGSLVEGWTKNMATASRKSSVPAMVYFGIWCAGFATLGVSAALSAATPWLTVVSLGLYAAYVFQVHAILRRIGSWNPGHALLFPLYLVFFLTVLAVSSYRTFRRREVTWKGRKIAV